MTNEKSNVENYMQVMDELSKAVSGDLTAKVLIEAARCIVSLATGHTGAYPARISVVNKAMLVVDCCNARCTGSHGVVDEALFRKWLNAEAALDPAATTEVTALTDLIMAAHMLVDIAINTCSNNPYHIVALARLLESLDSFMPDVAA